jgi:hypothetical protein
MQFKQRLTELTAMRLNFTIEHNGEKMITISSVPNELSPKNIH